MEGNQTVVLIAIVKNPITHVRTKHIDIHYHCVCEAIKNGTVELRYCPTSQMVANILTKPCIFKRTIRTLTLRNGHCQATKLSVSVVMLICN